MQILVTGGAGFIGSHLAEYLLRRRQSITVLDDLNDFYDPGEKLANLETVRRSGSFDFRHMDICDLWGVREVFQEVKPDAVVHLAARAGVRPSLQKPLLYEEVNVRGTMVLLEAARQLHVPKFVFSSSSSVYGVANQVPFREDDCSLMPISPYAATKIAGEKICYTYSHLYGMSATCLRFFTVFGPRQRPDLAIRKFMGMIDRGEPIPIYGDVASGRDYTYVSDIVQGIAAALEDPAQYETYNLGNSHPVRLEEMISTIEEALGKSAERDLKPAQPGDVPITYADISKAERQLGYRPEVPFREGIGHMAEWYRSARHTATRAATNAGVTQ